MDGANGSCPAKEQIVCGFGAIHASTVPCFPGTGQLFLQFVF
jgi:hypothetical protein